MAAFYHARPPANLPVDPLRCHEDDLSPFWEEDVGLLDQCWAQDQPPAASEVEAGRAPPPWDWDEEAGDEDQEAELAALLSKEAQAHLETRPSAAYPGADPSISWVRLDAVRWLLKACARHGFCAQTALLAVDYVDRFLSSTHSGGAGGGRQLQQPWMAQLLAVACLSLAAKMEETHVPLLLDLQVEEARYVFEARTVRRMELLVLSTLGWRMGAPTAPSFIDHFLRRRSSAEMANGPLSPIDISTAIRNNAQQLQRGSAHLRWKFQARCHSILLDLVDDSRWVRFPPSVLAAATMLHCLAQLLDRHSSTASSTVKLRDNLMNLLSVTVDRVQACTEFILDATRNGSNGSGGATGNKRKQPSSPRGVADATFSYGSRSHSRPASASPDMPPPGVFKRLHSVAAPGSDGEQCCPWPLLDGGVFV